MLQNCLVLILCVDVIDELKLLEVLGIGAFGVVHRAVWRGMVVAAKVMRMASPSEKVTREVETLRYT